jgi:hypothetical protein
MTFYKIKSSTIGKIKWEDGDNRWTLKTNDVRHIAGHAKRVSSIIFVVNSSFMKKVAVILIDTYP